MKRISRDSVLATGLFVVLLVIMGLTHARCFASAVAINPNGRNYASGAEDGYVRLHAFDKSYLDMKDPVPEADDEEEEEAAPAAQ